MASSKRDLTEEKATVLRLLSLHPSKNWYRQCLENHLRASDIEALENDETFLKEVQATLTLEKEKLLVERRKAMDISASKGGWQGLDKILQEIDNQLFVVARDSGFKGDGDGQVHVYLPENNRDNH